MSQAEALEEALASLTRIDLPSGPDFHYNNTFAVFREPANELKGDIRRILLQLQGRFGSQQVDVEELEDSEDGGTALSDMVEGLLDDMLEKVDNLLDRARAQLKAPAGAAADPAASEQAAPGASQVAGRNAVQDKRARTAFATAHTDVSFGTRPQDSFDPPVDNSNSPFRPRLDHWTSFQRDAGGRAATVLDAHAQRLGLTATEPGKAAHPLDGVLENLTYQDWQLQATEPQLPQGLDETPLTYVDTAEGLRSLAEALSVCREVAIDLEAHSYRSFQGFCCLMQLSTRSADYLVDVIALRSQIGPVLAPVFANTRIVKVLHGSDSDIVWLQRDFGIYVGNLFDTGQAARVLAYPSAGLAYLLSHFCSVKADKRWQLADWRVRPLSAEALHYARMDTHYLLYIYDCLKAELAKQPRVPDHLKAELPERGPASCLGVVLERSRLLCLQRYEKELFTETSYLGFYRRCQERLTREQLAVFAGLYAWRDRTARERDESTGFVLSRALLVKLAKRGPATAHDLRGVLGNQGRRSAPLLMELANEIVEVIANAQQQVEGVPDPDNLPGDRSAPSPVTALAARESAVDEAFAIAAAEAAGGSTSADWTGASDLGAASAAVSSSAVAARSLGSAEAASPPELESDAEKTMAEVRAATEEKERQTGAASRGGAAIAPLVPKQLPPLGGAAKSGTGLGAMLGGGGARRPSGLGMLFGGRPQTVGPEAGAPSSVYNNVDADRAGGTLAAAELALAEAAPGSGAAASGGKAIQQASFGVPSGSGAKLGAAQPASSFGRPMSALGASLGAGAGKAPSGLGALLGGRKAVASPLPSSSSSMLAATLGTLAHSGADQATKEAVEELKAQFALPFGLPGSKAPAQAVEQSTAPDDAPMPEASATPQAAAAPATPEEARAAQAASVREVMDQLRSENRFDILHSGGAATQAHSTPKRGVAGDEEQDQPEDYLPLPMSEQYKLPSKKKRKAAGQAVRAGAEPHSDNGQPDAAGGQPERIRKTALSPEERERLRCAAEVRATLEAVGLGEEAAAHRDAAHGVPTPATKKQKKASKLASALLDRGSDAVELLPSTGKGQKKSKQKIRQLDASAAHRITEEEPSPVIEQGVIPFDFAAARASASGLDISGEVSGSAAGRGGRGGRGSRGGGRGGRGGRDRQGEERGAKKKGFNPWDAIQEEAIKGGKRSAVMPRSGNRTMTFG